MLQLQIVFSLGILNAILGLALIFTCRCIPGMKVGAGLLKKEWFKRIYKYHCYLWWIFWPSVLIHATLAINLVGIPF